MSIGGARRQGANFVLPELSFLRMALHVIEYHLLAAIEAHAANVFGLD